MDEKYRLVFRGEVLDGQHRAVVKRRLVESLKLTDEQAEKLFSGSAVVLKKAVDKEQAARYQALFKKAGGRLRVHSLAPATDAQQPEQSSVAASASSRVTQSTPPRSSASASAFEVPPAATSAPQPEANGSSQALSVLSLEEIDSAVAQSASARVEISAPDFGIAELGADLVDAVAPVVTVVPETDFSLAETGVDLLTSRPEPEVIELGPLDFEVAEVGATLVEPGNEPVPPAPDISHLRIAEEA